MYTLQEMEDYIEHNYQSSLKSAAETRVRETKNLASTFLFIEEAASLGLVLDTSSIWGKWRLLNPEFEVTKTEDWRIIHQLCGKLVQSRIEPASDDGRKQIVRVYLRPEDEKFKNITFHFLRKLSHHKTKAKDGNGKSRNCRLKRVTRTSLELVCE